jgi:flagellar hook-associated protein FlgK
MFFRFHRNGQTGKFINLHYVTYAEYVHGDEDDAHQITVHLQRGSTNVIFDFRGEDAKLLARTLGEMAIPFIDAPADKVV